MNKKIFSLQGKNGFLIMIFIVVLGVSLFPIYFVKQEKFFYFWDFEGYQLTAIYQAERLGTSFADFWNRMIISIGQEYSAIYTLFVSPIMYLVGNINSRVVYIASLTIALFLPYVFLIGLISQQMDIGKSRKTFLIGVLVCILTPAVWLPTLRGYPDIGASALIALAIFIYFKGQSLKEWWQVLLIGSLLALAILFRRHYIYEAIVFFTSMGAVLLFRFFIAIKNKTSKPHLRFIEDIAHLLLVMLVSIFILVTIGKDFLQNIISHNYFQLYSSYLVTSQKTIIDFQSYYGWILVAIALAGNLGGFRERNELSIEKRIFILFYLFFMAVIWFFFVRLINPQYTLHFTTPLIIMIVLFFHYINQVHAPIIKIILSVTIGLFVLINLMYWLYPTLFPPNINSARLLSDSNHPLIREDYNEVKNLVNYLHQIAGNSPIYVVASSSVINPDMLISADRELFSKSNEKLNILRIPEVDSRDYYPIETLLQADYVVLADPFQHHLAPSEQDVVKFIYDIFIKNSQVGQDFIKLNNTFKLEYGTTISIYKRITDSTISQSLNLIKQMQSYIPTVPGNQFDWVRLNAFSSITVEKMSNNNYRIGEVINSQSNAPYPTLLYIGTISGDFIFYVNRVTQNCGSIIINLSKTSGKDIVEEAGLVQLNLYETTNVSVPISSISDQQLLMTIEYLSIVKDSSCKVEFDGVEIATPDK